jgi:signal transduction histidine kinase
LSFDTRQVQLNVRDDGCGFDYEKLQNEDARHFGLVSMQERAARIGGTMKVNSRANEGTDILVEVPLSS